MREDRTKQKMEYTLLLLVLLLMIVVLMMTMITKCKTLQTHMHEFNLLFLSYPECFLLQVFLGFPVSISKC